MLRAEPKILLHVAKALLSNVKAVLRFQILKPESLEANTYRVIPYPFFKVPTFLYKRT